MNESLVTGRGEYSAMCHRQNESGGMEWRGCFWVEKGGTGADQDQEEGRISGGLLCHILSSPLGLKALHGASQICTSKLAVQIQVIPLSMCALG